jgi:hypothetical protein
MNVLKLNALFFFSCFLFSFTLSGNEEKVVTSFPDNGVQLSNNSPLCGVRSLYLGLRFLGEEKVS